jgi:hypothetical protein
VRYLGDAVRRQPRQGMLLAWVAFDRAEQEIKRRRRVGSRA